MGRELRRVPLDFDWPLDQVWTGFLPPENLMGTKCADCDGSGQTHTGWWIQRFSQRIGMLASDIADQRQGNGMHPWLANDQYPHGHFENHQFVVDRPTDDIVDLLVGLAAFDGRPTTPERVLGPFNDASYYVMHALARASGVEDIFVCKACHGEGSIEDYAGQFAERDSWESTEPPAGDGWQLWETVSEGSPITPVFRTSEGLINHLVNVGAWRKKWSRDAAETFVYGPGRAPSMVVTNGRIDTPETWTGAES